MSRELHNRIGTIKLWPFAILVVIACACASMPTPTPGQGFFPPSSPMPMSTAPQTAAVSPTATIPPTITSVTLQTWRYEPFALTLSYPKDWYPQTVREVSGVTIKLSYPIDNPSTQTWAPDEKCNIQIWQTQLQKGETFDDWVRAQVNQKGSILKDTQQQEIVVADVRGIEFINTSTQFRQVTIPIQGFVYNFRFAINPTAQSDRSSLANMFGQILATAKIDSAQLTQLANATPLRPTIPANWTPNLLRPTLPASLSAPGGISSTPAATTSTSSPPPTVVPTANRPSPTVVIPTQIPTKILSSPTPPPLPPGVYVTKIRMEPANPNAVEDIRFFVTFWNTAGPLQFKWCVYIYNVGAQNPRGQTSCNTYIDFPLGSYEYSTPNAWKLGTGAECTDLTAHVVGIETNGNRLIFKTPDFNENSLSFRVCP